MGRVRYGDGRGQDGEDEVHLATNLFYLAREYHPKTNMVIA